LFIFSKVEVFDYGQNRQKKIPIRLFILQKTKILQLFNNKETHFCEKNNSGFVE